MYFAVKNYPSDGLGTVFPCPTHFFNSVCETPPTEFTPGFFCSRYFPTLNNALRWINIRDKSDFEIDHENRKGFNDHCTMFLPAGAGPSVLAVVVNSDETQLVIQFRNTIEFVLFLTSNCHGLCQDGSAVFRMFDRNATAENFGFELGPDKLARTLSIEEYEKWMVLWDTVADCRACF